MRDASCGMFIDRPCTTRDLLSRGFTDRNIATAVRRGEIWHFAQGVLVPSRRLTPLETALAAVLACGSGAVASHHTAALIHGLAGADGLPRMPGGVVRDRRPQVTVASAGGVRAARAVHVHRVPLPGFDVVVADGVPYTSVARTLTDLLLSQSREIALVAIEDAINRGLIRPDCQEILGAILHNRPGAVRARVHLRQVDPRSRSPLETLSRLYFADRGLHPVAINSEISCPGATYFPDFIFRSKRAQVIGEADGMATHEGQISRANDSLREDDLRHLGFHVVRWTWDELAADPDAIVRRIRDWL